MDRATEAAGAKARATEGAFCPVSRSRSSSKSSTDDAVGSCRPGSEW